MRNLASTVTEEMLEKAFSQFGKLERVKKLKDYAFIHFEERDGAVKVWMRKLLYGHKRDIYLQYICCHYHDNVLGQFNRRWLISMAKKLKESTLK